ncbi:hypothetical protein WOLCODRAFT_27282 [Wolfiporia cocos MD-104 SS10]|uniref:Uncharacterized protein n=1 Tax=Wolfiporia cocos (strain MD-104) TaxID=742152 RepID=A0A2H3IX39_WOLCO|nr:hypothetical protein WOLCODRAFT_27282 [Wolfiporia cocos MD-104 SS10]
MSVLAQRRRARRLARMRVYNLRYLSARRGWGPFHPADEPPQAPVVVATAHNSEQGHDSDGESAEDSSERSGSDMDSESSDQHASDEDSAASDAGSAKEPSSAAPAPAPAPTQPGLPSDAQLYPDWAYLAAIRTIVEANLREAVGPNELNGLLWLDGLRMGSAPMDISEGAPVAADVAEPMVQFGQLKGKERAQSVNLGGPGASKPSVTIPGEGWDWAGVTGVWRRCICWMDYRDLVLHNLSSQFDETSLQEAVRIVPMRLRVASYSPSSVAAYPDRPTIHFEGETAGTSANNQVRKVRGSVSVIADGSVKWAIKLEDSSLNWVSIGVQIGGPTTAMGVLGIWTGASHERVEPLGPFWAWKVG